MDENISVMIPCCPGYPGVVQSHFYAIDSQTGETVRYSISPIVYQCIARPTYSIERNANFGSICD